ncbi:MAG: ATP-binding cassette domain-containing protein [Acidobacteriaceae bacterium]
MTDASTSAIEFCGVSYRLPMPGGRALISDLNLSVPTGKVTMLLGRSGSGKTTALKLINRLLVPSAGSVRVNGAATQEWDPIRLRRGIGYAIQEVGLFPHYSVERNIAIVPRLEGWDSARIRARVREVLEIIGLPSEKFAARYPDELSGGERQRVGLARALAADPPILLMDEPFGALDPLSRMQIQQQFLQVQRRLKKTVVFVSHDLSEALLLGDHIAFLDNGRLRGVFSPHDFLHSNDTQIQPYVAAFREGQLAISDKQ